MKRLDSLEQIASETLGGLTAGQTLKHRIRNEAQKKGAAKGPAWRMALTGAMAVSVAAVCLWVTLPKNTAEVDDQTVIHSMTAGNSDAQPMVRALLDLAPGSIKLQKGGSTPEFQTVWAPKNGADFPLVAVDGKYYRLMQAPSSVTKDMLGDKLCEIDEYTSEPSLSNGDANLSNVVKQGKAVYAISGMNGAAVAANVDGTMRVFQRVSYAGNARVGKESLADTLKVSGKIKALELSGVGTIADAQKAKELIKTLTDNASYENATLLNADRSLLIQLDSGLTMQLMVKGDTLSACGSWSCPEFFEAFANALE